MDELSLYRIIRTEKLTGGVDDLPIEYIAYKDQEGEFHMETFPSQDPLARKLGLASSSGRRNWSASLTGDRGLPKNAPPPRRIFITLMCDV
jgi:hypothetical protein